MRIAISEATTSRSVHPTLDRGPCAEFAARLRQKRRCRRAEGDQDGDAADRGIAALRVGDPRRERRGFRVEARFALAVRDLPRFGKDRVALHVEVGQRFALGRREHGWLTSRVCIGDQAASTSKAGASTQIMA